MEIHFNVDNIDYIQFIPRRVSDYKWYPALPRVTFLHFFTKYPSVGAGWSDSPRGKRVSESYLKKYDYIYNSDNIDDGNDLKVTPNGSWYKKSYVYVRTRKDGYSKHFDSDENALTWIDDVKSMAKSKFSVIING